MTTKAATPVAHNILFAQLLKAQQSMNDLLFPEWQTVEIELPMAVADEALECAKHAGFEWWKKNGSHDLVQMQFEYVDAMHFFLGVVLKCKGMAQAVGRCLSNSGEPVLLPYSIKGMMGGDNLDVSHEAVIYACREVARAALNIPTNCWSATDDQLAHLAGRMRGLAQALHLDAATAASLYFAKNVLNAFRKANGYKDGTYVKTWEHGLAEPMEDNVYLAQCVQARLENGGAPYTSLADAHEHLIPLLTAGYAAHALGGDNA